MSMTTDHSNLIPVSIENTPADSAAWGAIYDQGRTSFSKFLKVLAEQQNPRNIEVARYENEARTVSHFVIVTWTPALFVAKEDHRGDVNVGLVVKFYADGSFKEGRRLAVRKTTDGTPVLTEGYGKVDKITSAISWAKSTGVLKVQANAAAADESARIAAAKADARATATKFFFEDDEVSSTVRNLKAEAHRDRAAAQSALQSVIARAQDAINTLNAHPDFAYAGNLHLESIGRDVVEATQRLAQFTGAVQVLSRLGVESPIVPLDESKIWAR